MSKIHRETGSKCLICDEILDKSIIFHKTRRQTHSLCLECGIGYLSPILTQATNNVRKNIRNGSDKVKCPGSIHGQLRNICKHVTTFSQLNIPKSSISLDVFRLNYALQNNNTYICPETKCGQVIEVDEEYIGSGLVCYGGCSTSWCRNCLVSPYHNGKSCIEIEAENKNTENGKLIWDLKTQGKLKFCPTCRTPCIKNDGCFSGDTNILMWSGEIKLAKDINVKDELIGDDGNKRTVTDLVRGIDYMYKVHQTKAVDYIVNGNHTLVLKAMFHKYVYNTNGIWKIKWFNRIHNKYCTKNFILEDDARVFCDKITYDDIVHITVNEYLTLPKITQKYLVGFRSNGVNWKYKNVKIDPYLLGTWLGGGFSCKPLITSKFSFFIRRGGNGYKRKYIGYETCETCDGCNNKVNDESKRFPLCDIERKDTNLRIKNLSNCSNHLTDLLNKYNLIHNKHIPLDYLTNSRKVRLSILAGIIDTDGCVSNGGKQVILIQSNKLLSEQILQLCMSLGFVSTYRTKTKKQVKFTGQSDFVDCEDCYIINISGNKLSEIPTLIYTKKCVDSCANKDYLRTNITISPIGEGKYYGWVIDKNHKFVMSDFTVTHNCNKMICGICGSKWCWLCEQGNVDYDHFNSGGNGLCNGKLWEGVDENGNNIINPQEPLVDQQPNHQRPHL